jgi:hypothetical protein
MNLKEKFCHDASCKWPADSTLTTKSRSQDCTFLHSNVCSDSGYGLLAVSLNRAVRLKFKKIPKRTLLQYKGFFTIKALELLHVSTLYESPSGSVYLYLYKW